MINFFNSNSWIYNIIYSLIVIIVSIIIYMFVDFSQECTIIKVKQQ